MENKYDYTGRRDKQVARLNNRSCGINEGTETFAHLVTPSEIYSTAWINGNPRSPYKT